MPINDRLVDAALPIVAALKTGDDYDRARRVERAIDRTGRPVIDPRDFISLRSPDGSIWRVRVNNSGVLSATRES